jgi:hypothetical protein
MGIVFSRFRKFSVIILLNILHIPFACTSSPLQFWCSSFSIQPWCWCLSSGSVVSSKGKKKRVWRQLCECLFEAAAHLPPTVSHLLTQALFIADLKNELYTHLALQALFI